MVRHAADALYKASYHLNFEQEAAEQTPLKGSRVFQLLLVSVSFQCE